MNKGCSFKRGDIVVFTPDDEIWKYYRAAPQFYPLPGTTGTIVYIDAEKNAYVRWKKDQPAEMTFGSVPAGL